MSFNVTHCHTLSCNITQCHTLSYNVAQGHTWSHMVFNNVSALLAMPRHAAGAHPF
jgi:hypothetical protein